jgi:VWFA-related protein
MSGLEDPPVRHALIRQKGAFAVLALLPLLALAPAVSAAPPATPRSFEETSQVVSIEVPVQVTGRDGQPVRGLTAADFTLYDQGAEQKLSGFEVVDLPVVSQGPPGGAALPPGAQRHFLFLFDLSFSSPTAILRARLAARQFLLRSLRPTDLAAVATYSLEQGPRLVVTFTPDRAELARAIDTLGLGGVFDARSSDPLRFLLMPETAEGGMGASAGSSGRNEEALQENLALISKAAQRDEKAYAISRLTGYARALGDLARALDSVRGRKQIVLFSEGFDSQLLLGRDRTEEGDEDTVNIAAGKYEMVDSDNRYGNTALQGEINRMLEEFRRADCVIQAVDIGGLRAESDATGRPRVRGQETLFYLANETGGELFRNANDLVGELGRVVSRSDLTYVLTFERGDLKHDGTYRRLRVKAKLPPGARLSYRSGYYAPRPFKDLDPLEKNLLAADGIATAAPRKEVDVAVLAAPFRSTRDKAYVPVILEVGGRSLLEGQTKSPAAIEIYAYVSDAAGRMRDFFTRRVGLDLQRGRDALLAGGFKYYGHFDLPPGDYRLRVLVRNAETGRAGVATLPLTVPAFDLPALLPPFFFEEPGRWLLVKEAPEAGQTTVVYPFTVNGEPYVPAARPILQRGRPSRLCLVAYRLGAGAPRLSAELVAADGRAVLGGSLSLVERTATGIEGVDRLLATFDPQDLAAGDYRLEVTVTDPGSGERRISSLPVRVAAS